MKNYLYMDKLIGCLWLIKSFTSLLISDFEKLPNKRKQLMDLWKINEAYMHAIIVNFGKIFSDSEKESFSLEKLSCVSSKGLKHCIIEIKKNHTDTIEKIITNRKKLVAHLDKNYFNLCFSDKEINRMKQDMQTGMRIGNKEAEDIFSKFPKSKTKSEERYTPNDLRDDLPEIKIILGKVEDIIKRSLKDYQKRSKGQKG